MLSYVYEMEENNNSIEMFLGLCILSFSFSFFIYRKLKCINALNKNVEKFRMSIDQVHQIGEKITMATSIPIARRNNSFVRFITNLTGSGSESGSSCVGNDNHEKHAPVPRSTAEAGSQVCDEILTKRERRSRVQNETECDYTPREGFIQEIFDSPSSSASQSGEAAKLPQIYTCAVCLDEVCLGNTNITTTTCGHTFHLTCLLKSLTQKNLCPMCRGELEDVRTKQMPSNILTPTSAEQMIQEEVSYFDVSSHTQSITLSRHPKRRVKEMLRIFGFTLLRNVAEYVHDENIPTGWFDDSDSESETEGEDEDDEEEGSEGEGEDEYSDTENANENQENDEFNYAVETMHQNRVQRDLRDEIGNSNA